MDFQKGSQLKGYLQRQIKDIPMHSNYAYNYYFCRSFLERLYANDNEAFILRGSFAQFALTKSFARPLTDIDIITFGKIETGKDIVEDAINTKFPIQFKIKNRFVTTNSTINYKILCAFDSLQHLISIDLKKNEMLDTVSKPMPVLFEKDREFNVTSTTLEEHLSSKLYVLILNLYLSEKLGKQFRRLKDFYDVYKILEINNIDHSKTIELLKEKIKSDQFLSSYDLRDLSILDQFVNNNRQLWIQDSLKYEFDQSLGFDTAIKTTSDFIRRSR